MRDENLAYVEMSIYREESLNRSMFFTKKEAYKLFELYNFLVYGVNHSCLVVLKPLSIFNL